MHVGRLLRGGALIALALLMSACATVDFKHPELAAKWAKGGPAFASADYLKVYDNQLVRLSDYAKAEDASVARLRVACRDATIAELISGATLPEECKAPPAPPTGSGSALLQKLIDQRLQQIVGGGYLSRPDGLDRLSGLKFSTDIRVSNLGNDQFVLDTAKLIYAESQPAPIRQATTKGGGAKAAKPFDTNCEALLQVDAATAKKAGTDAIQSACQALQNDSNAMGPGLATLLSTAAPTDCTSAGAVGQAPPIVALACEIWGTAPKSVSSPADAAAKAEADLVAQLNTYLTAAKGANTASQDELKTFGQNLQSALDALPSGYDKVEALQHLSTIVDAISRADVCNEQAAFDKATVTAAKCDKTTQTPTEAQASASWAFLNSLMLLSDATNPASRSTQWLAAAQAIIAAQKADAKLQADAQKTQLAADRQRFNALVLEATQDAKALQYLREAKKHPCGKDPMACALPLYVDALNRGGIPAALLAGRAGQIAREYAVRRERAAADKESQLLIAASNQLDAGTQAGIDRDKLIGFVFDAIVAGVALSK